MIFKTYLKRFLNFPVNPIVAVLVKQVLRLFKSKNSINEKKYIVIFRLDGIGDVVLTTPLIRELKKSFPSYEILLVVSEYAFNLVELNPHLNEILIYPKIKNYRLKSYLQFYKALQFSIKYLWNKNIIFTINPRWDIDNHYTNFIAYFSYSKKNYAYSEKVNKSKSKENWLYDKIITNPIYEFPLDHEVLINLNILTYLNKPICSTHLEISLSNSDIEFAQSIFKNENGKKIAIGPGALDANRMWPIENFISVINKLLTKYEEIEIIILGGNHEKDIFESALKKYINESNKIINLCGCLTLRQVASILSKCDFFIVNDTGLKHISAAMKTPVLEISRFPKSGYLMHNQSPYRFRSWEVKNNVLQPEFSTSPCKDDCIYNYPHCIKSINIDMVMNGIDELDTN
jgi:ADP-heptose:LPS heptosyltransferase